MKLTIKKKAAVLTALAMTLSVGTTALASGFSTDAKWKTISSPDFIFFIFHLYPSLPI